MTLLYCPAESKFLECKGKLVVKVKSAKCLVTRCVHVQEYSVHQCLEAMAGYLVYNRVITVIDKIACACFSALMTG